MLLEREAATATLSTTLQEVSRGRGRVVVLEGEPGIGKSALLQAFCAATDPDVRVHWGWNDPLTTPRPLGPLRDMAAVADSDVGTMLREGAPADLIFSGVLNALARLQTPAILIFEDLHWADDATLDLIRFLGRRVSLLKVMIVVTVRPTEIERDHPVTTLLGELPAAAVRRIALAPLSQAAIETLAGTGRDAAALFRITAGNPFFVTELLAGESGTEGVLPVSIRDAVWARWARLSEGMQVFLDMISILPAGAAPEVLPALAGDDSADLAEGCIERGLLRRDEKGALIFRHELARQATLERISLSTQKALHARMDEILSQLPNAESDPNIISQRLHHLALSGHVEDLLELAPTAADQAAALGAHHQAAAHLSVALRHIALAPRALAARIWQDWAHETFLAGNASSQDTMTGYLRAIALFRSEGDIGRAGLNLCRLARLHWRLGNTEAAVTLSEEAVAELEALAPSSELALAYSTRSQFLMLQDRFEEAIAWGKSAMDLSDRLGEIETRIHALNNVGTSLMMSGRTGGDDLLSQSLTLSLENGYHDHASRAYTNFSECCMLSGDFETAEQLMTEGIAFCVQYDLDAAAHYLLGKHAHLRMEQGRLHEAKMIAEGVIAKTGFPPVMHLPALLVLGRVTMRLGYPDGRAILEKALDQGRLTGEPQRIIPARLALIEAAWLSNSINEARRHIEELIASGVGQFSRWDLGELATWMKRLDLHFSLLDHAADLPAARAAELEDDFDTAASLWLSFGQPYEAALSLMQVRGDAEGSALSRAVVLLDEMEAREAAERARKMAAVIGLADALPKRRRGPYASARLHPLGLTRSEQKVVTLLVQGLGNKEIARALSRSARTVEHQVSSVLAKFNASNRMQILLRVRNEPWLAETSQDSEVE